MTDFVFVSFSHILTQGLFRGRSLFVSSFGPHSRFHPHGLKKPGRENEEAWHHKSIIHTYIPDSRREGGGGGSFMVSVLSCRR